MQRFPPPAQHTRDASADGAARAQLVTVPVLTALADEESHQEEGWQAFVDVSEDGGETFIRSANVAMPEHVGVIQPTLWESNAGTVHMMLRSNAGHIYRADSVRGICCEASSNQCT